VSATIRAIDPDMPGNEPWLTLGEAGRRSGRHPDTLRAMIRRGRLEGQKGNRGEWLVRLPARMLSGSAPEERPGGPGNVPEGDPDDPEERPGGAGGLEEVAELRQALGRAEGELAAKDALVAELCARAERAEVRADRLEAALAEARRPWLAKVLEGLRRKGS
jgi:hypothetical protein